MTCLQGILGKITASLNDNSKFLAQEDKGFWETLLEDRPISGISYVRSQLQRLEVIPTAHAQQIGFGFGALSPILTMWQGMRNTAYVFLIIATLVLAFMIMFRVKISPQVVITAQSALPRIITAIILVTFSYAIAGFLVDLMYVVIGLVSLTFGVNFNVLTTFPLILSFIAYAALFLFTLAVVLVTAIGFLASGAGLAAGVIILTIPGVNTLFMLLILLIALVVLVLLIIHFFRTLFMLIKAFANILLLVIFAPLQLVAGAVVDSLGFNSWLRSFISNLAVFVVTGLLLALSNWFLFQAMASAFAAFASEDLIHSLANVFIGTLGVNTVTREAIGWPPLLGWGTDSGVALIMLGASFVVFTLIPRTTEVVQGLISGRPFAYGSAVGETIAPLNTAVMGGINYGSGRQQAQYQEEVRRATAAGDPIAANIQRSQDIGNIIRGISGGRVK